MLVLILRLIEGILFFEIIREQKSIIESEGKN